jgi:hypothetical protein
VRPGRAAWLAAACLAPAWAWAQAPHAHGVAKLDVALEARRLAMDFVAPLEDILGFERRPANEKEGAVFEAASAYFKSGRALVASPAANCRVAESAVNIEERGKGHFEWVARLTYDCKEPQELREVDAALLEQYKKLKRIDVRVVAAKGQSSTRLGSGKRTFGL